MTSITLNTLPVTQVQNSNDAPTAAELNKLLNNLGMASDGVEDIVSEAGSDHPAFPKDLVDQITDKLKDLQKAYYTFDLGATQYNGPFSTPQDKADFEKQLPVIGGLYTEINKDAVQLVKDVDSGDLKGAQDMYNKLAGHGSTEGDFFKLKEAMFSVKNDLPQDS